MKYKLAVCAISLIIFSGCRDDRTISGSLEGQWFSIEWSTDGDRNLQNRAWMSLNPDSTYRAIFIRESQAGSYRVDGDHLSLSPEEGEPKVIDLSSLVGDTLVVEYSSETARERVTFVRRN